MSELITVARPYAKAAFDYAVEHNAIDHWQQMLIFASEVVQNPQIASLLSGALAPEKLSEVVITVCGEQLDKAGQNLIRIMAENHRLPALPDVADLFQQLRTAHEAVAEVEVISARKLKKTQLKQISTAMEKRLSQQVKLTCSIDKSVLGGVIIRTGDEVIDGSIRGRLDRLADLLQS